MSQIDTVSAACRVLLKYLINCLQSFSSDLNQNSAQIEIYLNAVRVLCIGTSPLSTAEVSVLVNTMKGENLPQHTNTTPPGQLPPPRSGTVARCDRFGSSFDEFADFCVQISGRRCREGCAQQAGIPEESHRPLDGHFRAADSAFTRRSHHHVGPQRFRIDEPHRSPVR